MTTGKYKLITLMAVCLLSSTAGVPVRAQSANPHAVSLYNLGLTAYKQGSPESAIIFFKRATDIDPNLTDAHYNLGVIYVTEKRYREAIPRFEEVLRIKPGDGDAHYQLGCALQESGQLAEAKQHFTQVPPSSPSFPDAQSRISSIDRGGVQSSGQPAINLAAPKTVYSPGPPISSFGGASGNPDSQVGSNAAVGSLHDTMSLPDAGSPSAQTTPPTNDVNDTTGRITDNGSTAQAGSQIATMPAEMNQEQAASKISPQASAPQNSSTQVSTPPVPALANISLRVIATGFSAPAGLAFDKQGNLYVANYASNSIDRITTDGIRSQFAVGANIKGPIGVAVDDSGTVYVANYSSGTVARVSPAGVATLIATGFHKPYYLTLDQDGNLYVSQQEDNSIVRVNLAHPGSASAH